MSDSVERPRQAHGVTKDVVWARRRRVRGDRTIKVSLRGPEMIKLDRLARHYGLDGRSGRQDVVRTLIEAAYEHLEVAEAAGAS